MSDNNFSQFMIGGAGSGSGKTTISLGIMRALARRGLKVAPFKCGPDYIDPLFHRQAAGRPSINLDAFFCSLPSYNRYACGSDVAVVEGVMGLFDGTASDSIVGSSGEVAKLLKLPVLLTLNARGISGSIAPLVKGFSEWHPDVKIIGVIADNVGSSRHAELLSEALDAAGLPPLLGALQRNERWTLPERHLGLSVGQLDPEWLTELADAIEEGFDLDRILSLTYTERPIYEKKQEPAEPCMRLGVAHDDAFCFYYEENFAMLRERGVEIVPFSPLNDSSLPPDLDGLYLGGGYPELYAEQLSANVVMLNTIRVFARSGKVIYGECGGYIYMLDAVSDFSGQRFELLGLLPGEAGMNHKLAALGYREIEGELGAGRGHEFHYSSLVGETPEPHLWHSTDLRGNTKDAGTVNGNIMGSYIHVHFASSPDMLNNFIKKCLQ